MNTTTPDLIEIEQQTGSNSVAIAAATIWMPEEFTRLAHRILFRTLMAGLKKSSIRDELFCSYFRPEFSITFVVVSFANKEAAIKSLKETLEDVHLLSQSALAVKKRASGKFEAIYGTKDGTGFHDMFCKEEFSNAYTAAEVERKRTIKNVMPEIEQRFKQIGAGTYKFK